MIQIGVKRYFLGIILILTSVLAGCSPSLPTSQPDPVMLTQPAQEMELFPTAAPGLQTSPTASLPALTVPPTGTSPAPMAPPLAFAICTPIQDHPLDQLRLIVSDPYRPPKGKSDARHHGVDFSYYRYGDRDTIQGVGVQAVLPGKVAAALVDSYPFGNLVMIETEVELLPVDLSERLGAQPGESLYLLYAHMEGAPLMRIGDQTDACQLFGAVGKSGNAVEPHLHLETRLGPAGTVFSAMGEYFAGASEAERAAYRLWRTSGVYRHLDPMLLLNYALEN